jgi:hypothetical protein
MKQALALAIGAAVIFGITYEARSQGSPSDKADKVKVCHVVGNGSAHVVEISRNALQTHLDHGDNQQAAEGLRPGDSCRIVPANAPPSDVEK